MYTELRTRTAILEDMYNEHFSRIFNYIFFRVRHTQTAEDLTADVFVRAYQYLGSFDSEKGEERAWLTGIARNTLRTHFQRVATTPTTAELSEALPADVDIEEQYLHSEDTRWVIRQVRCLPQERQELLAMKFFLRMNNREIARATGMSESNVGTTLHRIITDLRKKLEAVE